MKNNQPNKSINKDLSSLHELKILLRKNLRLMVKNGLPFLFHIKIVIIKNKILRLKKGISLNLYKSDKISDVNIIWQKAISKVYIQPLTASLFANKEEIKYDVVKIKIKEIAKRNMLSPKQVRGQSKPNLPSFHNNLFGSQMQV